MANGLLLFMTDIDPAREDEFNRWYEEEHLGERMAIPDSCRRDAFRPSKALQNIWRSTILNRRTCCSRRLPAPASRPGPGGWKRCSSTAGATSTSGFRSGAAELFACAPHAGQSRMDECCRKLGDPSPAQVGYIRPGPP